MSSQHTQIRTGVAGRGARVRARHGRRLRRGTASLLAMLFLILFSAMAVGFYGSTTMSVQVASNDKRSGMARVAAESGMQFLRYHLANLGLAARTPPDQLFQTVYDRLAERLNYYPNMPANARTIAMNAEQTVILIPGAADAWINADSVGSQFRAELHKQAAGEKIEVRVFGRFGTLTGSTRGIRLEYANFPNPAAIFNYGVASRSKITMGGNVTIRGSTGFEQMGSVLSAVTSDPVALEMTGNAKISGHASFVNPNATPSISTNSSVAGLKPSDPDFAKVIHKGVEEPEFPLIDTSAFAAYVPSATAPSGTRVITTSTPSGTYFKNIRIKANANPTFNADTLIQGVVYIESPNQVKFNGGTTIQGAVVVVTDLNNNESLSLSQNVLDFSGNVSFKGLDTLPDTSDFPASLRQLTGSAILAPGFQTKFAGNFGTVAGTIAASQLAFTGNAGGTIKGSVINLRDSGVTLSGTSDIVIESQGTANHPAGVFFGSHYSPLPYTYEEMRR